jgi:hypothetical protein
MGVGIARQANGHLPWAERYLREPVEDHGIDIIFMSGRKTIKTVGNAIESILYGIVGHL